MESFLEELRIRNGRGAVRPVFIGWHWAGHTKAWTIPGTEDLKPDIPRKTLIAKWGIANTGDPRIAAALAGIMSLFF